MLEPLLSQEPERREGESVREFLARRTGVAEAQRVMDELYELGATVVAVSDISGGIHSEAGLDVPDEARERVAVVNANLQESLSGVRVAQAYSREGRNEQDFRKVAGKPPAPPVQNDLIELYRTSVDEGGPRPKSAFYSLISSAIQARWHSPESVDPDSTPKESAEYLQDVLQGEALL